MDRADVIIFGGGMVGLALAAALDSSGVSAVVIDPADPAPRTSSAFDGRTSAVSSSSMRMLETIGVTQHLPAPGCPIRRISVADGLQPGGLHFDGDDEEPLGWMHENRHLRAALQARAEAGRHTWLLWKSRVADVVRGETGVLVSLEDGRKLNAPLLVAADGRNSRTREEAGIRVARWSYRHQAIVSVLRHQRPHDHVAYEIFYPSGPFALLPMTDDSQGHRSAIVWSVRQDDAAGWLSLSDEDFAAEAEAAMGGFLGKIAMLAPRSSFPLGFHHAAQISDKRLALIGDAAHAIHPIAGQGVNLGFRDAAALAQVLVEGARLGLDLGDAQLLARYQRWRSLDALSVAFATDSLTRIYGIPGRAASAVRRFGMGLVERISPVRDRLMSEARGTSGDLPLLLRGLPI
ncbi:UbiH/UbiF/VisC/COQ6 family ubiquinone biosynthesis hydroxylase [Sphingomonas hankyongi]|uniref:UbiH/UbiF/VisC/COQ6 family ubiquinone biosynthesis hydroxylase n=1 Tax=Sphingomonas hankyongi TaxID=2908209 RepID=A0ABT0S4Z5_9SPHN|nr:UbiH/UbiF/VisC/COQ6 family ubiquinone biosynthesis hydroxylase [Sphingomonas hankyongi]MCL6730938.1 UbiH/UbiF/VisC/COQ6 family ubiquinone biosynthesis hydroxylase [Sphingomonas hankyongi]